MDQQLEEALRIRYLKLYFTIALLEDTELPCDKVSALRGGMGGMLLRANCVRDRKCKGCDFETECIVHRTLYSRYEVTPKFVTTSDSIGYILECDNSQKNFSAGEVLQFNLILFGRTITYSNQYIQAFSDLGRAGLGKNHSRFQIVSVTDRKGRQNEAEGSGYGKQYQIRTLGEYAANRVKNMKQDCKNSIRFLTPLTLKYHNEFLEIYHMEAIWNAVRRRIYMLECYEGISSIYDCEKLEENTLPVIMEQVCKGVCVRRYSTTQGRKMKLWGIKGYAKLDTLPEDMLLVLAAGELTHIGKNTSFGFGKYRIV